MDYSDYLQYASDSVTDRYQYEKSLRKNSKPLQFGTGGIRAQVGVGKDQLNRLTIAKFMLDFSSYAKNKKIIIFYDSRFASYPFAKLATQILKLKNIEVALANTSLPTPVLSYVLQSHNYDLGLMFTASHNAYTDAGIKVYNQFGNQITEDDLSLIQEHMTHDYDAAASILKKVELNEQLETVDFAIDYKKYIQANLKKLNIATTSTDIVFSPLHGVGSPMIPELVLELNYINLHSVHEQEVMDGFFETVNIPNPEDINSFEYAIDLAKETGSELIVLTDADCDRVGLAEKVDDSFYIFNGNEIGVLLFNFLYELNWNEAQGVLMSSVVSSDLPSKMAEKWGVPSFRTLTGFKYIGELMNSGENLFFGFEESGGYLVFDQVKDKDGVQAAILSMMMKAHYKSKNRKLVDVLEDIYREHGYFKSELVTYKQLIDVSKLNFNELLTKSYKIEDYKNQVEYVGKESVSFDSFPKTDMIKVYLDEFNWFSIRPSGTESILKIYFQVFDEEKVNLEYKLNKLKKLASEFIEQENNND